MKNSASLVVGGDSLVGKVLAQTLEGQGHCVYSTTRRINTLNARRIFLDFEKNQDFTPPANVSCIYVVAAATSYEHCENDPIAYKINVELIPRFIEKQLQRGFFIVFISTNSVFGGERPWPLEDDPHTPRISYAKQKSEAESLMRATAERLGAQEQLAIVRLTKILDSETSPLPSWFDSWGKGRLIRPFDDLIFSPISPQFVARSLVILGEKRISGNLHLSGAENISYVFFAKALAIAAGISLEMITPTTAIKEKVFIPFKPIFSGIGMERTTRLTGILPQELSEVISDLYLVRKITT